MRYGLFVSQPASGSHTTTYPQLTDDAELGPEKLVPPVFHVGTSECDDSDQYAVDADKDDSDREVDSDGSEDGSARGDGSAGHGSACDISIYFQRRDFQPLASVLLLLLALR